MSENPCPACKASGFRACNGPHIDAPLSSIAEGTPDYAKMERVAWAEVERTVKACSDEYPAHVDLLITAIRRWGFAHTNLKANERLAVIRKILTETVIGS